MKELKDSYVHLRLLEVKKDFSELFEEEFSYLEKDSFYFENKEYSEKFLDCLIEWFEKGDKSGLEMPDGREDWKISNDLNYNFLEKILSKEEGLSNLVRKLPYYDLAQFNID